MYRTHMSSDTRNRTFLAPAGAGDGGGGGGSGAGAGGSGGGGGTGRVMPAVHSLPGTGRQSPRRKQSCCSWLTFHDTQAGVSLQREQHAPLPSPGSRCTTAPRGRHVALCQVFAELHVVADCAGTAPPASSCTHHTGNIMLARRGPFRAPPCAGPPQCDLPVAAPDPG